MSEKPPRSVKVLFIGGPLNDLSMWLPAPLGPHYYAAKTPEELRREYEICSAPDAHHKYRLEQMRVEIFGVFLLFSVYVHCGFDTSMGDSWYIEKYADILVKMLADDLLQKYGVK